MMPPKLSVKDWLVAGLRRLLAYTDTYQVDKDWQQALYSLCELSKSIIKCYDILSHIRALKLIKKKRHLNVHTKMKKPSNPLCEVEFLV